MKRLLALAALLCFIVPARSEQSAALTVEELVNPHGMVNASLSPDGKHIAAVTYDGHNYTLLLVETASFQQTTLYKGRYTNKGSTYYFKGPRRVQWVGNELLVVNYGREVGAIDLKGNEIASFGQSMVRVITGGPNAGKVLVTDDSLFGDLALCDPLHGDCKRFSRPSGDIMQGAFDRNGELRAIAVVNSKLFNDASTVTNWYRPAGTGEWIQLDEFKITGDYWLPAYVFDTPDTLAVSSRIGRDTHALFQYDAKTRRMGEMLAGHPTQDIVAAGGLDRPALSYVTTAGMRPERIWFNSAWHKMQVHVDRTLPDRINHLSGNPDGLVLVHSSGDVDPGTWYLFDLAKAKLTKIGKANLVLDPAKLRPVEAIEYRAPDGLTIPAFLTRPAGQQGPAPMVVLIHGGPVTRDEWEFNAEVQLLANRGYLVFQPQFRGSAGFGRSFERAGYQQWGRAMQDDITAGVEHLIKEGLADRMRICIVGASYGGYAALWGLIKTPSLYRCGVSFAGVTDIGRMYSDWSDTSLDKVARQLMAIQIGERGRSAELFDPVSPLRHADKINVPVLLMHGLEDVRVPISHGEKMRDALERHKKSVTWVSFPEEGHGLHYIRSQQRYYKVLLKFLGQHIGPAPKESEDKPASP